MPGHLIAITPRPQDAQFCGKAAELAGLQLHYASTAKEAAARLSEYKKAAVVFWDVDHPEALDAKADLSFQKIGQLLLEHTPAEHVFAVSDQPMNEMPYLFNIPAFCHHFVRNPAEVSPGIFARIAAASLRPDPFGLANYLPQGTAIPKITLKSSKDRGTATEAIAVLFAKRGIPAQLVSLVTQAADELLMNAIFDAPVNGAGNFYRKQTPRTEEFALGPQEAVTLEMGVAQDFIALSVTDLFGSLKKDTLLSYLRKDYERQDYRIKASEQGAGLGIYGMMRAGLSLMFIAKPKVKTEVVIFFPVVKNFKGFRNSFRLFSALIQSQ